eukprot:4572627-Prymnesium_polylepis.1
MRGVRGDRPTGGRAAVSTEARLLHPGPSSARGARSGAGACPLTGGGDSGSSKGVRSAGTTPHVSASMAPWTKRVLPRTTATSAHS